MIVMKFGGSSVANAERIKHVASIIKAYKEKKPVVVLSAMGDTTDHLLDAADQAVKGIVDVEGVAKLHKETAELLNVNIETIQDLLKELNQLLTGISMLKEISKRSRDYLVSFGERMSVRMMAAYLTKEGIPAKFYDAWDIGILSDSNYMAAELLDSVWDDIPKYLTGYKNGTDVEIPIVTGFIAKDVKGNITTLGRGGSDLTATMIGAAMQAEEVQTWKDVDGILTTDPRIVKEAKPVPEVTYEEAQELAMFGAQVLHPRSMVPVRKSGTPVRVKNSYNITSPGSIIVENHTGKEEVYAGSFYGTLKSEVERIWAKGHVIIFDIDVQGGVNLKRIFGDKAFSVFIQAPSVEVLRERLIGRGTDTLEAIEKRVAKAASEMEFAAGKFDHVLINDDLP